MIFSILGTETLKMANCIPYFLQRFVICKNSRSTFKRVNVLVNNNRRYVSALLASTDNRGKETFSFLSPYMDMDQRLLNSEKLEQDMLARGFNMNINEIKSMWEFYKLIRNDKSSLEMKSNEIVNELKPFFKKKDLTPEEQTKLTKLTLQIRAIRQDLKTIKGTLQDLNESILQKMLQIPNEVDKRTPLQTPVVLKRVNSLNQYSNAERRNHIEIGRRLGLLEYMNPMQYYLCNDAALFEFGVLHYAGKVLSADNMIRVAGADFSRSLVVDGSGLNHEDPSDAFIIDNHSDVEKDSSNRMHLVGGASLISFLAMHTKQLINPNHLPITYFSTGRQYTPFRPGSTPIGLFTVCQSSAALAFTLVKDGNSQEYDAQFERLLATVSTLYDNVCDHYQIVIRPASELRPWETMRVSFELWSSFTKQYIEVGHVSVCGEYFSKRLLIAYQTPTGRAFPSIISGTVLSVPRLLGCLLEQNPEKFVIPPKILEHSPVSYVSP